MSDINPWAVVVAALASFLVAGGWYALMGSRLVRLNAAYAADPHHPAATAVVEMGRGLVISLAVSILVAWTDTRDVLPLLSLAVLLFVAFPLVLLAGSVWHEKVPSALAAIHAADWLLKLLLITLITGLWR